MTGRLRVLGPDLAGRLDPAPVGEPDVHHDDVGTRPVGLVDRLANGAGLGRHDDVVGRLEKRPNSAAHDLVVVDQQDA